MPVCIPTSEYTQHPAHRTVAPDRTRETTTMSDAVLLDIKDGIALVTLNRPEKLNALNYELIDRLMARMDMIDVASAVRAVILTAAGDRAFSAGAAISELSASLRQAHGTPNRALAPAGQSIRSRLRP